MLRGRDDKLRQLHFSFNRNDTLLDLTVHVLLIINATSYCSCGILDFFTDNEADNPFHLPNRLTIWRFAIFILNIKLFTYRNLYWKFICSYEHIIEFLWNISFGLSSVCLFFYSHLHIHRIKQFLDELNRETFVDIPTEFLTLNAPINSTINIYSVSAPGIDIFVCDW